MLIEALQPERTNKHKALDTLETGSQRIVNVEVADQTQGRSLISTFEDAGYRAAYFECNGGCHDGHVLARCDEPPQQQPTAQTDRKVHTGEATE